MPYSRSFDELNGPMQPICRHLRSKAMYVSGQLEPTAEMEEMGSGHCWCNHTQQLFGPDSRIADRRDCNSNRPCYEATL